jgi:hypothetical protein
MSKYKVLFTGLLIRLVARSGLLLQAQDDKKSVY